MTGLSQRVLMERNKLLKEFKGALTEKYVLQQLKTIPNLSVYYYTNDRNPSEIDFVVGMEDKVVSVEVKAEINLMAKSLKVYRERYKPELSVRLSTADYEKQDSLINLPLYAVEVINSLKI